MEAIAQFWILYLIAFPVFLGLAFWNQIKRMKRFMSAPADVMDDDNATLGDFARKTGSAMFQGIIPLIIWGGCALISGVLLVTSIIVLITQNS